MKFYAVLLTMVASVAAVKLGACRPCRCCKATIAAVERVRVNRPRGGALIACASCAARIRMQRLAARASLSLLRS